MMRLRISAGRRNKKTASAVFEDIFADVCDGGIQAIFAQIREHVQDQPVRLRMDHDPLSPVEVVIQRAGIVILLFHVDL